MSCLKLEASDDEAKEEGDHAPLVGTTSKGTLVPTIELALEVDTKPIAEPIVEVITEPDVNPSAKKAP